MKVTFCYFFTEKIRALFAGRNFSDSESCLSPPPYIVFLIEYKSIKGVKNKVF